LAAGIPKVENQLKSSILRCGPDFVLDQFNVRTKDNAVLKLTLSYKWKFLLDDNKLHKIFLGDFIGYSCQSLRSRIRETSSQYNFEKFHIDSAKILRKSIFKNYSIPFVFEGKNDTFEGFGRLFDEMNFFIFELDVKEIIPVDQEIKSLLEESIKSNMTILCSKLSESASNEQEKEKILQECEIESLKHSLIKLENENLTSEILEKEKINGNALIEKAKAEKEAFEILQKSKNDLEVQTMKETMNLLKGKEGERYLEYMKIMSLNSNVQELTVVPSTVQILSSPNFRI
jgi:major vault protein